MSEIPTTTSESTKKAVYKSRYSDIYGRVSELMQKMQRQQAEGLKELAQAFKELQGRVAKLEREADKQEARTQRRRQNTGPEQSFQGVNQCKRIHSELLTFLNDNKAKMGPVGDLVRAEGIMSLNEVNRCILAIGKNVGVVMEVATDGADGAKGRSSWFYNLNKTDTPDSASFVASMSHLLVDLMPAEADAVDRVKISEPIEIRKMSRYFKHLLAVDEASQRYVAERIEAKRREITLSSSEDEAVAVVAAATTDAPAATAAVAGAGAGAAEATTAESMTEESAPKKRKLARKPATTTTA
jgi:hypothetical protein